MIRRLEDFDIKEVVQLETDIFGETLGEELMQFDIHHNPYANYFVYEIDDKIVGYVSTWMSDFVEILNFLVKEEYRGRHIGTKLLEHVLKMGIENDCTHIVLEVRKSNAKAIKLYVKEGFEFSNQREKYYKDGEDAWVMTKKIK